MPIQPKLLEEIMHEWKNEVPPMFVTERDRWLRSALASHLLWAAQETVKKLHVEQIPELEGADAIDCQVREDILTDYHDALKSLAQKLIE